MNHTSQRNIKIIDELMNFCYTHGAKHISIDINNSDRETFISLESEIINLEESIIQKLENLLNIPRCHEMEESYWELNGDDDTDCELSLIGMMIDTSVITYNNDKLNINVSRIV